MMGVSDMFALVITRQSMSVPISRMCSGVYGSITPTHAFSLRCVIAEASSFSSRTMGFLCPSNAAASSALTRQISRAQSTLRHITAKGFSSLRLRARSSRTVSGSGRQARCIPPSPFTQTISPALSARRASSMALPGTGRPCPSRKKHSGPHSGQQFGCA